MSSFGEWHGPLHSRREVDTCRICRGEGTPEEPLYHPCKCSGSIKYVHQDCLMEWLQHSQRKQSCELCKTPFKFTKLYSPDMPSHIPPLLFLSKIVSHIRTSIMLYLRLMLVCFVWLGWLPLSTRYAVRFYFWVSDEMFDLQQNDTLAVLPDGFIEPAAASIPEPTAVPALSNVTARSAAFGDFTTSPLVNKILVDTFEGQVITGLVVLIFVIIFLIREWVLQNAALNRDQDIPAFLERLQEQRPVPPMQPPHEDQAPLLIGNANPEEAGQAEVVLRDIARQEPDEQDRDQLRRRRLQRFGQIRQQFDEQQPYGGLMDELVDDRVELPRGEAHLPDEIEMPDPSANINDAQEAFLDAYDENRGHHDANNNIQHNVPLEPEQGVENNGFWDLLGAWFRDNILGEGDGEGQNEELVARGGFDDVDVQRNLEDELDEDGDDFDGIMELIGMRGPLPVLFQNGIFSTILVTGTLGLSLWVPYLIGKVALLVASNPVTFFGIYPMKFISFWANQIVDICISAGANILILAIYLTAHSPVLLDILYTIAPIFKSHPEEAIAADAWSRIIDRSRNAQSMFNGTLSEDVLTAFSRPIWIQVMHGGVVPTKVTAIDRAVAILAGYSMFTVMGAWYVSRSRRVTRHRVGRALERIVVDVLRQAGAIMKVIFIIGIELAIFPLFCGVLLDVSFMPLFDGVSVQSRWVFSLKHPLPSTFLHWFVGTCYMFHFALFVSMCRDIVRPGVLYFIRDPNDPNFHPIRDVLDRPVLTQLRKIAISALIYSSLICFCLGGVVYALKYAFYGSILPINWQWGATITEFPIDLLLYYIFIPFVLRFFKPSGLLKRSWSFFFTKAASWLRLTSFLFNIEVPYEEGSLRYRTLASRLKFRSGMTHDVIRSAGEIDKVTGDVVFVKDGSYVRAPNSDSVHLRKGRHEFVGVTKENRRLDGKIDRPEDLRDIVVVYAPPQFRIRIGLLLIGIWLFAAATGLAVTVGPLLLGRKIFSIFLPEGQKMNDIYCLTVGGYIFCAFFIVGTFVADNWATIVRGMRRLFNLVYSPRQLFFGTISFLYQIIKVSYVSLSFGLLIPSLLSLIMEFYIVIPLHLYFTADQPVIHFMQGWALGVLYSRMLWKVLTLDGESRWARAYRQVFALGYFNPNIKIATKSLIVPIAGSMTAMLLTPVPLGWIVEHTILRNSPQDTIVTIYRFSYPVVLVMALALVVAYGLYKVWNNWKTKLRDEVYLIGEQLHNHAE
ncbi:hypothetical protein V1525DRAFT_443315 [Lipomyces kononenkoae]|uniref:Uncharacterized protein n=1 Tax=Lipomyces kononenkoae TaxID=34357 RepID=A0ACC3T118_LIPKO